MISVVLFFIAESHRPNKEANRKKELTSLNRGAENSGHHIWLSSESPGESFKTKIWGPIRELMNQDL